MYGNNAGIGSYTGSGGSNRESGPGSASDPPPPPAVGLSPGAVVQAVKAEPSGGIPELGIAHDISRCKPVLRTGRPQTCAALTLQGMCTRQVSRTSSASSAQLPSAPRSTAWTAHNYPHRGCMFSRLLPHRASRLST
jgi:hypothetical protein